MTQLAWFDEDKRFAISFNDGLIYMGSKEEFQQPIVIEAHQVITHTANLVRYRNIKNINVKVLV